MALTYVHETYSEDFESRLDKWLMRRYPALTQGKIQKSLRERFVRVNSAKSSASTHLKKGDKISIEVHLDTQWLAQAKDRKPTRGCSIQTDFSSLILEESEDILVLNKPSGLDVQGGTKVAIHLDGWLKCYCKESRLVHRIDKMTSGLLLVAKNLRTAVFLAERFRHNEIKKTYRAIVSGHFFHSKGIIETPIGDGVEGEKDAITHYSIVREATQWTEVELKPQTGRKHQLRIHMASLGHPIIGDTKYDLERQTIGLLSPKTVLFLHAYCLNFVESSGRQKAWQAPLPEYWPK